MAAPPLTHHDILALAGPLARHGRHVDLAGSDRSARRIAFRAREARLDDGTPLQETLQLDALPSGNVRLLRTLTHPVGGSATLEATGASAETLLARIDSVPASAQLRSGPGWWITRSDVLTGTQRVLARGTVRVDGLALAMTVSPVRGVSADIVLTEAGPDALALPEDLLAVLGWDWARLIRQRNGWRSKRRLRGDSERRTRTVEAALERAAVHLARTLAEPPARYHERLWKARYGAMLRRAIPLLTPVALVITVLSLPRFDVEASPLWVLLYHVPTVLIALSFLLQELPAFEIPPWPRAARDASWRVPRTAAPPR